MKRINQSSLSKTLRWLILILPILALPVLATSIGSSTVTTVASGFPANGGIAIDSQGNFYVSDFKGDGTPQNPQGRAVRKITPNGTVKLFTTKVITPTGLLIAPSGDLYVSNAHSNSIVRVTPDGQNSIFAEHVPWPSGILFDADGNLLTPNCTNETRNAHGHSIYKISPEGMVSVFLTSKLLQCGVGIAMDDEANIYVANWNDRNVLKVTPEKEISLFATIPGNPGESIANMIYLNQKLYIAGFSTNRVWQITLTGNVSVLAGNGIAGHADGNLLTASFNQPNGIVAAISGKSLFVLDVGGETARVRRIDGL